MYGLFSLRHVGFSSPTRGCWLKRCTIWEFWVKFYLGQNQDCSPGAGTSDSSERLLQRGSRTRSIYDFGEVGVQCSQALALQKVFCWSEGADVTLNGFSAFLHMKRCKDWDHLKRSNYINICSTRFPASTAQGLSLRDPCIPPWHLTWHHLPLTMSRMDWFSIWLLFTEEQFRVLLAGACNLPCVQIDTEKPSTEMGVNDQIYSLEEAQGRKVESPAWNDVGREVSHWF